MKKILTTLLFATNIAFGSIHVSSAFIEDQYQYDLDIALDFNKYVFATDFLHNAEEGSKLWYELTTIKPSETGWYTFDNYSSDLAVGEMKVYETELLIYTDVPQDYILDEPWAFRTSHGGFGAGYDQNQSFTRDGLTAFNSELYLEKDVEYIAVFSSFVPDAYGTLDVRITGYNSMEVNGIPEPSSIILIAGFLAFGYVMIKRR